MTRVELPAGFSLDQLDDLVVAQGLQLLDLLPASDTHPAQQIYIDPEARTFLHLVEEPASGRLCFLLQGPSEAALGARIDAWIDALSEARVA